MRMLLTAIVLSSLILVTLMMEALSSSETSVLTRVPRRNNSEDAILHNHLRENLKSHEVLLFRNSMYFLMLNVHNKH
jgi:hypothetical protein